MKNSIIANRSINLPDLSAPKEKSLILPFIAMLIILAVAAGSYYVPGLSIVLIIVFVVFSLLDPPLAVACAVLGYLTPLRLTGLPPIMALWCVPVGLMGLNTLLRRERGEYRMSIPIICCLAVYLVCTLRPSDGEHGTFDIIYYRVLGFVLGVLTAFQLKTERDRNIAVCALFIASTILSTARLLGLDPNSAATSRAFLGYWDRNYMGCNIGLGVIPAIAWMMSGFRLKSLPLKIILLGLIMVNLLGIMALLSRGTSIAMALTILAMLAFRFRKIWQLVIVGLLLTFTFPLIYALPVFEPLKKRFEEKGGASVEEMGGRRQLAEKAIKQIGQSGPVAWCIGEGTGANIDKLQAATHNMYLSLFMDYGLMGFLSMAFIAVSVFWRSFFEEQGWWRYGLFGSMLFILLCGFGIEPYAEYYAWIILGTLMPSLRKKPSPAGAPAVPRKEKTAGKLKPLRLPINKPQQG